MRHRPLFLAVLTVALATPAAGQPQAPEHTLTLVGTAADDGGGGVAIIQRADGGVQFLELGQVIDGFSVLRIEPALAVLQRDEAEITLRVAGADPTGPPGSTGRIRADFRNTLVVHPQSLVHNRDGYGILLHATTYSTDSAAPRRSIQA
jgi:hypothetical protein